MKIEVKKYLYDIQTSINSIEEFLQRSFIIQKEVKFKNITFQILNFLTLNH